MTLGMIWTIILRFAIQDISVEGEHGMGVSKEGERAGPDTSPANVPPSSPRNLGQGRPAPVVPAEDGAVPQRQRAKLPHQVCQPVSTSAWASDRPWGTELTPVTSHRGEEVTAKFLEQCLNIGGLGQCRIDSRRVRETSWRSGHWQHPQEGIPARGNSGAKTWRPKTPRNWSGLSLAYVKESQ